MSKSPERETDIKSGGSIRSLFLLKRASESIATPRSSLQKPVKVHDKYFLKSLYEEIDLYDRKLAHMAKFERFASEAERGTVIAKMTTKRATLERTARKLMEDGIEFQTSNLPRSFRPQPEGAELVNIA